MPRKNYDVTTPCANYVSERKQMNLLTGPMNRWCCSLCADALHCIIHHIAHYIASYHAPCSTASLAQSLATRSEKDATNNAERTRAAVVDLAMTRCTSERS